MNYIYDSIGCTKIWSPDSIGVGVPEILLRSDRFPTGPINLHVYRADLLQQPGMGALGLFHTGLGFEDPRPKEAGGMGRWALDLAANTGLQVAVIPTVTPAGSVAIDARCSMTYYPDDHRNQWSSYWTNAFRSAQVCTISPSQYRGLLTYLFTEFVKKLQNYSLFIMGAPNTAIEPNYGSINEVSTSHRYTSDMTCDTYCLASFMFLQKEYGVPMAPFPLLRIHVSCLTPPVKVLDRSDPELVAFVKNLQMGLGVFEQEILPDLTKLKSDPLLAQLIMHLLSDASTDRYNSDKIEADLKLIAAQILADTSKVLPPATATMAHAVVRTNAQRADLPVRAYKAAADNAIGSGQPDTPVFMYSLDPITNVAEFYRIASSQMSISAATTYTILREQNTISSCSIFVGFLLVMLLIAVIKWYYATKSN